jgi:hypothetical protein
MKFILANLILFVVYFSVSSLLDLIYVRDGQPYGTLFYGLVVPVLLWTAVPVAWVINTWLVHDTNWRRRLMKGAALAALAIVIAFGPYCLLGIQFHLWIGGSL